MQRGEAYFLEADAENNNGGNRLTKQTALNWLQKYTLRDKDHPVAPWPVSKALNLLAGVRPDACIDTGFDPAFPLAEEDKKLGEALDDASQALALVLNDCEDAKNRKRLMRFFELGRIRFALRINDDVDLLRPEEYFMRIANEKLPLRLYHKVGAVLFSHEYFSRDVPVFGLFHDFTREKDGRAECETVDDQLWQRLQRSLTVEDCREAKSHDVAPWDIPIYKPLPFVEPAFSNNQCSAACSLSPAPPMPDAFLPPPLAPDDCLEVEAPKAPAAAPFVVSDIDAPGAELLTDEHEIVPGITVGDVRAMIDANSPAYCPRLLAAIQTKIALMPRESVLRNDTVYERYAKTESVSRLKALGVVNPKDKSRNPDPADLDVNAVARILCRKHKKKEGHPGSL